MSINDRLNKETVVHVHHEILRSHKKNENTPVKVLISSIYQYLKQIYKKQKQKIFTRKWAKDIKRHFTEEDIDVANKHMKKSSISLLIRETQIKTTVRYHLIPVRMAITKKPKNSMLAMLWRRVHLHTAGESVD